MDCIFTDFGVDSLSGFPFRAWTDRQTDSTECSIGAVGYTTAVVSWITRSEAQRFEDITVRRDRQLVISHCYT